MTTIDVWAAADRDTIEAEAHALGVKFEPTDLDRLARYLALLLEANTRFNLTAVTEPAEAWRRHILDSLTLIAPLSELPENAWVIDIGSGGGLPGIPLAICLPHLRFTLIDATAKKTDFLHEVITQLELHNARAILGRAERLAAFGARQHREQYDAAIARAVGKLPTLLELVLPFIKPPEPTSENNPTPTAGGMAYLIKGQRAEEELAQAKQTLHMLHAAHAGTIETPTGRIVAIEKLRKTPRTYPRADGEPKRKPLGVTS